MSFLSDVYGFTRFASGLTEFLDEPISVAAAKDYIQRQMQARNTLFLKMVERAVFANPRSPYLKLFRAAGCEFGDVKDQVARNGLEGALQKLYQTGIFTTFEEFKGLTPAVRGSQTFVFQDHEFDNPVITTHFQSSTGGTRAKPTRIRIDLEHIAQSAPSWAIWFASHDWLERPLVYWTPMHSGIANGQLRFARFGQRLVKWFAVAGVTSKKDRLVSECIHRMVRRAAGFPKPELVPLSEAWKVGEYLAGMVREGVSPCINTLASAAVRTSLAMQERGVSLRDVTFILRGEPLTPTRKKTIEGSGAKVVQTYGFAEGGPVGSQCPTPAAPDDVHIFLDAFAVIQRARPTGEGKAVDALLMTALRPACPKIMLNTEIGDYGVLETRKCGCLFDEVGYGLHLHTIRSFEKLTGEGMTFVGADLMHILESVLPSRFGGTLVDYQLIEEEDARGLPRYTLLVSPEVGAVDEELLVSVFLRELGKLRSYYGFMATVWAQANIFHVVRRHPVPSSRGKILSFRTLGTAPRNHSGTATVRVPT